MHAVLCGESKAAGEGCGRRRLGWRTWRSWRGTATCRGKDAGQGDCSPHARGWTLRRPGGGRDERLLPARAGVDPRLGQPRLLDRPAPRTRGGEPPGLQRTGYEEPAPSSPQSHGRMPAMRRSHVLDRPKRRSARKRRTGRHRRGLLRNESGAFTPQHPCSPSVCLGARRGPPNQSRRTSPSGCPRPPARPSQKRPPTRPAAPASPASGHATPANGSATCSRQAAPPHPHPQAPLPGPAKPGACPRGEPRQAQARPTGRPSRPATRNATPPRAREPVPAQPRRAPGVTPRLKQSPEARPAPPRPASPAAPGWPPRRPRRRRGRFPRRPGRRGRGRPASRRR